MPGMTRFLLIFITVLITLFGVELLPWVQTNLVLPWTTLLARACVGLVGMFDTSVMAQGKVIWNPATGFGVSIEPGCNGVEAFIVLCAALIAFPSSWLHKAWGLVVGFIAIQALNVVRVISLFYLGQWNKDVFDFAHHYLWQGLIMLDVLAVWLLWIRVAAPLGAVVEDAKPEIAVPPAVPAETVSKSATEIDVNSVPERAPVAAPITPPVAAPVPPPVAAPVAPVPPVTGDSAFALPTRVAAPPKPAAKPNPSANLPPTSGADRW
jgi:exosortase H (IPTLxxWG-CTERM-specific)